MPILITGVPKSNTSGPIPPPRLEINDFVKDEKFFSLYVQALQELYKRSQTDKGYLSYFQISGIHGSPLVDWNGVEKTHGFCEHGTVIFPTWHRPYIALLEQVIHVIAVEIAKTYTVDTAAWQKAADDLRQPFWDWAKNIIPPKEIIELDELEITTPSGRKNVKNPFLGYKFHPVDESFSPPFNIYEQTLRYPTSREPDAKSNVSRMKEKLASIQHQITSHTFRLFSITDWDEFSTASKSTSSTANSLESIHNQMHNQIGGDGHMGSIPVAAFDPIFWLHHCQVDRLLSLWSAMHRGAWVGEDFAEKQLSPFWNTPTTFWSSAECRTPDVLNYSYPGLFVSKRTTDGMISRGAAELVPPRSVAQSVHELYGASAADPTYHGHNDLKIKLAANFTDTEPTSRGLESHQPLNYYNEWSARIRCNPYEIRSSFSVYFFLGSVPSDPDSWHTAKTFVGVYDAFVNDKPEECENCQRRMDENDEIEGFVHLNVGILKHSNQTSLEPEVVEPFLKENLHWGVIKVDGAVVELKSLEVVVLTTPLSLPPGALFPVASSPNHRHGITSGVPGGSRSG